MRSRAEDPVTLSVNGPDLEVTLKIVSHHKLVNSNLFGVNKLLNPLQKDPYSFY